jgi:NAD(P)-dependent dehydrogenase (short-subunit alcohol dehydrogenase family)
MAPTPGGPGLVDEFVSRNPLGGIADPRSVAVLVRFLVLAAAAWIADARALVDGGLSLGDQPLMLREASG